jgi:FtsH-binding integral membrane protein
MKHALLALALSGCVTTAGIVKNQDVSLPLLIGATVADLVVTSLAASQIQEYSYGGSLTTGLAVTAVDVAVGCLTGACTSLRL